MEKQAEAWMKNRAMQIDRAMFSLMPKWFRSLSESNIPGKMILLRLAANIYKLRVEQKIGSYDMTVKTRKGEIKL